jgi:hypothetical protein
MKNHISLRVVIRMPFLTSCAFTKTNIAKVMNMKYFALFLACIFSSLLLNGQSKADTLTNEKIVRLSKMGLQSSVIINKIQTSFARFDVGTDALIVLSDNNVSSEVINVMMNIESAAQNEIANQKDMNDPLTKRASGIYYYHPENTEKPIRRVDPTIASSMKSGGFGTALMQSYTYGLASSQLKSSLAGPHSRLQIDETNPTFYFYFDNSSNLNSDNWFFATATSPNEFILLKLTEKKSDRETVIGSENYYGSSAGSSNKDAQAYTYDDLGNGVFKIMLTKPLKPGEYCFQYASSTPSSFNNNKVFDFGIVSEEK